MEAMMNFELSKEYLERFQQALDEKEDSFIIQSFEGVKSADIAALLYEFDSQECKYIFDILSDEEAALVLEDMDEDVRESFLTEFSSIELARYIELLDSDNGADILYQIPLKRREEVIKGIGKSKQPAGSVKVS
jgi:magnesium transporter